MNTEISMYFGKKAGDQATKPLPPPPKPPAHPIKRYCKNLDKKLPKVDETGFAYKPQDGVVGHAAKKSRKYFNTAQSLRDFLPANPHYVSHPRERAQAHKQGKYWNFLDMKKALEEFYVPAGLKIVIICPELYDRDLLAVDQKFKASGGRAGVMSPCPKCHTNYYMRIVGWTSQRQSTQKVLNPQLTQDVIIGTIYGCHNTSTGCCTQQLSGNVGNKTRAKPITFTSYCGEIWKQFPDTIRRRYLDYVQDMDDRATELMLSPGFCDRLLFHNGNFEGFANDMWEAMKLQDPAFSHFFDDDGIFRTSFQSPEWSTATAEWTS